MRKAEIEVGKVYTNKKRDRFRVVIDLGCYPLYPGQADLAGVQFLQVVRRKKGLTFDPGRYNVSGKYAHGSGTYGQSTVASFATWSKSLASEEEANKALGTLLAAGVSS